MVKLAAQTDRSTDETSPARKRGRSSRPEVSARRDEIMDDAAVVFAKLGVAHATMRDVADETGILAGSLYHHFASKDELIIEIMQRFNDDYLRDMRLVLKGESDPLVRITNLMQLALRYITERPQESRILNNDAHYFFGNPALASIATGARSGEAIWLKELRGGIKSGALRPDVDPKLAYATIMGAIFSALHWYRPTGRISPDQFVERVGDQLLRGILPAS
jgi:AcrR family transcriptional regulator